MSGAQIDSRTNRQSQAAPHSVGSSGATAGDCLPDLRLTVQVPGDPEAVRIGEPVTVGLPMPVGFCRDEQQIRVAGSAGVVPAQAQTLEQWPDGSIRWALLDFQANAPATYSVAVGPAVLPARGLEIRPGEGVEIDSGGSTFRVASKGPFRLETIDSDGAAGCRSVGIEVTRADGVVVQPVVDQSQWEVKGPLRSVLRVNATVDADGGKVLQIVVRLHFYAGLRTVRFEVSLRNPGRAEHPGGFWELGDPRSLLIRECSVRINTAAASSVLCSVDPTQALGSVALPFELYQDSSGGDNWNSRVHVNRDGLVPVAFCGYRLKAGADTREGRRATPVLVSENSGSFTGVAVRHFWQNSPKSVETDGREIRLGLFPRQFADLHEIQGGEQKTHVFHVAFGNDGLSALPLDWARRPALATASAAWYCGAGAAPYVTPMDQDPNTAYVELVNSIVEGPHNFEARREVIDEFGWRNFGDIYADHEAVFHKEATPLISHYNNQYDGIAGFAYQFFRSADPRWWAAMEELAWHVRDIDIYHTQDDKSAYSGGLFWHTFHYVDAGKSTHRSYPKVQGVGGGGPANEQSYSTGLMLHYLLTGEVASREAAIELAEWVLALDDGGRTPFRWISRQDTGLASKTHSMDYHGPGRGAGNAIGVLLNGYRLTGRAEFLAKAEGLIRRCIHPMDDIDARGLLDAESRWSYTVFLQTLGRYLDEKLLRGEVDERYAYAQQSLLHYARWMAQHEYLYLDKPEILEYPTETWAAQDMRKSDVFKFAAKHSSGEEREVLLERSQFFFDGSMRMLLERPTRFTARPRVLMMICGFMHAALQTSLGDERVPRASRETGEAISSAFLPQKTVVRNRLKWVGLGRFVGGLALSASAMSHLAALGV